MPQGFAGGNQPDAPVNYPTDYSAQNMGDPYMDSYLTMQALQGGLPTMGGAGQGSNVPSMMENYQNQMQAPNAMLAAMTGRALNAPEELARLFPNNPRLGGALSNAGLAMSMIPTGRTIGENIAGVSNAMTELPYARLMHAYQMLQPGMQTTGAQANVMKALAQAEMFGGRNLAQVEAARQRDFLEQQYQSQMKAESGKQTPAIQMAPSDEPGGRWKQGELTYGVVQNLPVTDPKTGQIIRVDQKYIPQMNKKEYDQWYGSGGTNAQGLPKGQGSGSASTQTFNYLTGQLGMDPVKANQVIQDQSVQSALRKFGIELGDKTGVEDLEKVYASQNAAAKTLYEGAVKQLAVPTTAKDKIQAQIAANPEYRNSYLPSIPKGQTPLSLEQYTNQVYIKRLQDRKDQLDQAYSSYTNMAPRSPRPDFKQYFQQQTSQSPASAAGAPATPGNRPQGW